MNNRLAVILSAGFGGIAANLLKMAVLLTAGPVALPGAGYIATFTLGLLLMAAIGAGTALALKETSSKKAIFIGLGLPAFLQASASNISQIYSPKPPEAVVDKTTRLNFDFGFASIAFAETPARPRRRPSAAPKPPLQRRLMLETPGDKKPESVMFFSDDKQTLLVLSASDLTVSSNTIAIPAGAQSFKVNYKGVPSKEIPLDATVAHSTVSVKIEEKNWSGFWQAVGNNAAPSYEVTVSKRENPQEK